MDITHQYDDIINLPHHVSETRPRMALIDRAAQFAPYAALVGYDAAVKETARLTDTKLELDETQRELISAKLFFLQEYEKEQPFVTVEHFVPDEKKTGGAYVTTSGNLKKIDEYEQIISFTDGTVISFEQVYSIDSDLLEEHGE